MHLFTCIKQSPLKNDHQSRSWGSTHVHFKKGIKNKRHFFGLMKKTSIFAVRNEYKAFIKR
ncbi:hypothetical protein CDL62_02610 [Alkalitalea saponilacus]|nr:hypothetical protein CDL62_02610 [Alkalitalea saponilacus]